MVARLILLRLLLALALTGALVAPHGGHAGPGGPVMVICGAEGAYTVPLDPDAPADGAHDAACCLGLCGGALAAAAPLPPPAPRRAVLRASEVALAAPPAAGVWPRPRGPPVAF